MSNYTHNQYVDDQNSSWAMVFNQIKDNETVLDIGCSSGNFGVMLISQKQCIVDGIDIDIDDIALAQKKLRKTYVLDIEDDSLDILTEKYDVITIMDVIEHLKEPARALRKIGQLLKPGGRLLFSVPNMSHVSIRLELLLGEFNYRNIGLLDDTHLHFYTEKYLQRVLNDAGYNIVNAESSTITYPKQLIVEKLKEAGLIPCDDFMQKLAKTKGNIYQFVGTAVLSKQPIKPKPFPAQNPHEEHYLQIEKVMEQQDKKYIKDLKLKDQHIANLEAEIAAIKKSTTYRITQRLVVLYKKLKTPRNK